MKVGLGGSHIEVKKVENYINLNAMILPNVGQSLTPDEAKSNKLIFLSLARMT